MINLEPRQKGKVQCVARRDFLKFSAIGLGLSGTRSVHGDESNDKTKLRFGIVADVHYADAPAQRTRFYRESFAKLAECVEFMNEKKVDFLIELGDLKDQDDPPEEKNTLRYLSSIEIIFRRFRGMRYHVLGNHDMDSISKRQFLAIVENSGISRDAGYYSFDAGDIHFVVLDANYRADGSDYDHGNFDWRDANIPQKELEWLAKDLGGTAKPVIVFVHQQLDGDGDHCVRNAAALRQILQARQNFLAVFQGHNHAGGYGLIENAHYYTLKAMVEGSGAENNSYAIVEVYDDLCIAVTGYYQAASKKMASR
ncbi:hypothetical protein EH222_14255 [candidate division KSB1 bacterium]|nr:MAG: hypothetical protein EH222_14255 [candidate division KSB1 bacterium]